MKEIFKKVVVSILTAEAAVIIKRHKPTIVAITGSVGKTSTKDAVYAAIKSNVKARKSEKSFNSDIGVPLTVLGLPNAWSNPFAWIRNVIDGFFAAFFSSDYPDVLILEIGIDRPGDMEKTASWIKPDIVVLTRLPDVPVHIEYFSSPEAVIEEKMKLVSAMKPDGVLIYNKDDVVIEKQLPDVLQKQIGFSRYLESDFTAKKDKVVYKDDIPSGIQFEMLHNGENQKVSISSTVGTQHVYSCSAALAVAAQLGVSLDKAAESLSFLSTPKGRMRLVEGIKTSVIVDDTYNSSPVAVEQAIQAMKELNYANRKIAVLGDMLELGKYSSEQHKRIGKLVPESFDVLLTVGVRARLIAEGALSAGMDEENVFQYEDVARAGRELQGMLKIGDMVLVKASQGIRAERIVEEIMNNPETAENVLVRQDKTWKSIA